jgi:glucoamylase
MAARDAQLDRWIEGQYRRAAAGMLPSLSAVSIVKHRPGFGQSVTPKKGSIVASPVLAAYDPDPDYFFHWFRDSAVIIDALRLIRADGLIPADAARDTFHDFVEFSLELLRLDGSSLVTSPAWRAGVQPDFAKFMRTDADLGAVHGGLVSAEARVNPDATLDISNWARPQHDGPPLRLLSVLRWVRDVTFEPASGAAVAQLLRADIAFTRGRWRIPSFDIWEEEKGQHYYTLRVAAEALEEGARWLESRGGRGGRGDTKGGTQGDAIGPTQGDAAADAEEARLCRADSRAILTMLDGYWLEDAGYYRSRVLEGGAPTSKELDIAVIFAAIHGAGAAGHGGTHYVADTVAHATAHSVHDPRMQSTLSRLEALFDAEYPLNRNRPAGRGPALGRYKGDVYYSGGAYYFSTLAAAEFCFRAAVGTHAGSGEGRAFVERGNAYLETVRAYTPASGDMSEQFDQKTGAQTSARHLAWSYAAFISSVVARRDAYRHLGLHL